MENLLVVIILIVLSFLIAIFAIIVSYYEKIKYMETAQKLMEAGKTAEEISSLFGKKNKEKKPISYLIDAIITMGIGIGVIAFGFSHPNWSLNGIGVFLLILGLAFLCVYFLLRKKN